jgi:hypothetical protein
MVANTFHIIEVCDVTLPSVAITDNELVPIHWCLKWIWHDVGVAVLKHPFIQAPHVVHQ